MDRSRAVVASSVLFALGIATAVAVASSSAALAVWSAANCDTGGIDDPFCRIGGHPVRLLAFLFAGLIVVLVLVAMSFNERTIDRR